MVLQTPDGDLSLLCYPRMVTDFPVSHKWTSFSFNRELKSVDFVSFTLEFSSSHPSTKVFTGLFRLPELDRCWVSSIQGISSSYVVRERQTEVNCTYVCTGTGRVVRRKTRRKTRWMSTSVQTGLLYQRPVGLST